MRDPGFENEVGVTGDAEVEEAREAERRFAGGEGREEKIEEEWEVGEGGEWAESVEPGATGEETETGSATEGRDSRKTFHSGSNHLHAVVFFKRDAGSDAVGDATYVT